MEYKDTLLMPNTGFEMRGKLPTKEPKIQAKWQEENLYEKMLEKEKNVKVLFYMMGLPMQMGISI